MTPTYLCNCAPCFFDYRARRSGNSNPLDREFLCEGKVACPKRGRGTDDLDRTRFASKNTQLRERLRRDDRTRLENSIENAERKGERIRTRANNGSATIFAKTSPFRELLDDVAPCRTDLRTSSRRLSLPAAARLLAATARLPSAHALLATLQSCRSLYMIE